MGRSQGLMEVCVERLKRESARDEFSGRLLQGDRKWGGGWKWRERVEIAEDRVDSWTPV